MSDAKAQTHGADDGGCFGHFSRSKAKEQAWRLAIGMYPPFGRMSDAWRKGKPSAQQLAYVDGFMRAWMRSNALQLFTMAHMR